MSGSRSQLVCPLILHWHVVAVVVVHCPYKELAMGAVNKKEAKLPSRIDLIRVGFAVAGRARYPITCTRSMDQESA